MALIDLLNFQWVSKIGQASPIFMAVKKKRQHIAGTCASQGPFSGVCF